MALRGIGDTSLWEQQKGLHLPFLISCSETIEEKIDSWGGAATQGFSKKNQLLESGRVGIFHKPSEVGDKYSDKRPSLS